MAKALKTKPAEETLEAPAGSAVTADQPVRQEWPESTETRELYISLSDAEAMEQADLLIDQMRAADALAAAKAAISKDYAARIVTAEDEIARLSTIVKTRKDRRDVPCRWLWQTNGKDEEGNPIYHSDLKTLVREDSGEVIEIRPITQEDRQMNLPLEGPEVHALRVEQLKAVGWTVEETPDDVEHGSPFQGRHTDGTLIPLDSDNMAEAAQALLAELATMEPEAA